MLRCLTATGILIEAFHEINSNLKASFFWVGGDSLEKLNINVPSYLKERGKGASKKNLKPAQNICQMLACYVLVQVCVCVCVCV